MSLDVYLELPEPVQRQGTGIFVRENGATKEISREEWDARNPGCEPVVWTSDNDGPAYSRNITHNLGRMADAAGLYQPLWRPEEVGIPDASPNNAGEGNG